MCSVTMLTHRRCLAPLLEQTVRYTWQTGLVKDGLWVPGESDDQSLPGRGDGKDALSG